jgi:hypothetical protein
MSYFNHDVRRHVREQVRPYFPTMSQAAPMSPLHLDLGPYHLKVLHAEDGSLPYPKTAARERFYALNELGLFALNVFPPDQLYVLDDDAESFMEGSLVLIWDSEGPELTQATLIRPSRHGAKDSLDLLTPVGVADDLDEIRVEGDADQARQTGTGDGQPETHTSTDDSSESDEDQ